jgi:hypothetical protein
MLGVSTNISDSGICIYTFKPLETGQGILLKDDPSLPYRRATVQWVRKYHRRFYKAGLMFHRDDSTEDDIGEHASEGDMENSACLPMLSVNAHSDMTPIAPSD